MQRLRAVLVWVLVGAGWAGIAYPALSYAVGAVRQARLADEVRTMLGTTAATSTHERPKRADVDEGVAPPSPSRRTAPSQARPPRGTLNLRIPAPRFAEGQPLGLLRLPSIGAEHVFLEGVSDGVLQIGPGHMPSTTLPGLGGVSVLAAHRDAHFRSLKDLRRGDRLQVVTPTTTLPYRVSGRAIAEPDESWVTTAGRGDVLRLVTCWPPSWFGPAPLRLVVTAVPADGLPEAAVRPASDRTTPRRERSSAPTSPRGDGWNGGAVEGPGPVHPFPAGGFEAADVRELGRPPAPATGLLAGASLPSLGTVGATAAFLAAFGAARTRRRLSWWFLPWAGGLGLTGLALLAAWAGPGLPPV